MKIKESHMSSEYIPGVEKGTSSLGSIEIKDDEVKTVSFCADAEFHLEDIKRSDILDFGNEGFLLHNVLTKKESDIFVEDGERIGFEDIRGVRDDYRSNKRITINSPELAAILWQRIKDHVGDITIDGDPHVQHIHGIPYLMQGRWQPVGLNEIFRLCRYHPGQHFAPHFDGHFDRSPEERSLKTFMLYLNGDFTGGSTNFVNEQQTLHQDESGRYCAEKKNIIHSIKPETGLAIVFNHHRLHEGQKLQDGRKYILRTDIMFKNTKQEYSEKERQALLLLQQAETMENAGRCMEAAELYRKAFKLSPDLESST